MNKLYYITIATKPHIILEKIKQKVQENKEDIYVLGTQENRPIGWNAKGNFGIKLKEVKDFLLNQPLNNDDVILFTDAYDVIYCSNHSEILKNFYEFDHPIVFGAETECNPDPSQAIKYTIRDKEFSYLNSGLYIGYVWAIKQCILEYEYNDQHDDQLYWTLQYFKHPNLITLDYNNKLFLNTYNMNMDFYSYDGQKEIIKIEFLVLFYVNGPNKSELSSYF